MQAMPAQWLCWYAILRALKRASVARLPSPPRYYQDEPVRFLKETRRELDGEKLLSLWKRNVDRFHVIRSIHLGSASVGAEGLAPLVRVEVYVQSRASVQ